MTEKIVVYGHPACAMVPPIMNLLKRAKVDFVYVNIHQKPKAAAIVRKINHGYESVPTLVFPDGSTLTEPSTFTLKTKLESLGYRVNWFAMITSNISWVAIGILFLIAILQLLS